MKPLPQITPNSYQKGREGGLIFVEFEGFRSSIRQTFAVFLDPFPSSASENPTSFDHCSATAAAAAERTVIAHHKAEKHMID